MHRILLKAARALVGPDLEVVAPANIAVEGRRIAGLGDSGSDTEVIELGDRTLLPGFIDAHVHIGFYDPALVLAGGVTTVRDLGWPPAEIYPLARASEEETFDGPLILCVGPMLTVAGGYPTAAAWAPPGTARAVESIEDASVAVEEQAAAGASAIKVALNAAVGPTLDAATLAAICSAAHARRLRVTAHIYGLGELIKALDAGVDEMAHMLLSSETIPDGVLERMVGQGMAVVPTLSINRGEMKRRSMLNLAGFVEAGGRVVYGTDLGNSGPRPGIDRLEIDRMSRAGMDPMAIVASGTTIPARYLGLASKGVLAQGMDADLIAVAGDPLDTAVVLTSVDFVMREGRAARMPREP